jgi:hypothetical protein
VDSKDGVIELTSQLNPLECQDLKILDPAFTVASINGAPVKDLATACTNPWENDVAIRNPPGAL